MTALAVLHCQAEAVHGAHWWADTTGPFTPQGWPRYECPGTAADALNSLLAEQVEKFADMIHQRDIARDCAVALEQQCDALTERLHQLAGMVPHLEGDGRFHGSCLTCGMPWPCEGYGREVGDL